MKTWTEKLNSNKAPKVERLQKDMSWVKAGTRILIATPRIVDTYIRGIAKGQRKRVDQMREDLAKIYRADMTCPLSTGIFVRIVAEAAYEALENGAKIDTITPFWRIMDEHSNTAKKLSFGTQLLKEQRQAEGL